MKCRIRSGSVAVMVCYLRTTKGLCQDSFCVPFIPWGEGKEAVVLQNWGDIRNGNALSALLY